jgi:heme oxygenase (mycobilin-producing)
MKPIVLIHPFQVNAGQEEEFLTAWKAVDQYMKKQNGFIETKLHRSLNYNNLTTFSFVNIAHWESAEAFRTAISNDNFLLLAKDVLSFSRGPGLYKELMGSE